MQRGFWISGLLLIAACAIGCGKKALTVRPKPVYGSGSIKGVVKFIGTPPERSVIPNQPCHAGAGEIKDETVVVNSNSTLANTIVYLEGIAPSDGSGSGPVTLDQGDCRFAPHVVAVQVGQTLSVHNSDATIHNVHYDPTANPPGNFPLMGVGSEKPVIFNQPEFIRMKCDVHPWMTAYVGVFENPFFATSSDNDGSFKIDNVPAGTYTLVAWHEQYGEMKQQITVKEHESVEADFEYKSPN